MHRVTNITVRKYCSIAFQSCKRDVGSLLKFVIIIIKIIVIIIIIIVIIKQPHFWISSIGSKCRTTSEYNYFKKQHIRKVLLRKLCKVVLFVDL